MGSIHWKPEEHEVILEGKKESLSNWEITKILEEVFEDKYRVYNDNKIKWQWQQMVKKNPSFKQFSPIPGNKKGSKCPAWTREEDELVETLYSDGIETAEIANIMQEEFPNKRNWSSKIIENRISIRGINNRNHLRGWSRVADNLEELQSRCHPRIKVLDAHNAYNVLVECLDCGAIAKRQSPKLWCACGTCENKPDTPQDLYLIEFSDFDYPSCKVGISRDYYGLRSKAFDPHEQILVIHTIFKEAKKIEDIIKKEFEIYKTNPHELFENGHTECFDISLTEQIKNRIEELHG